VSGASVRGATHERRGLPNQDAIAWLPSGGAGATAMVAVADGHGSDASCRSDVGAHLAVTVACERAAPLLDGTPASAFERAAAGLPAELVDAWRAAVADHLARAPLTDAERALMAGRDGDPFLAYGSTLLVAVAGSSLLLLQLGDGDVLVVADDGATARPLPDDDRNVGERTLSLCLAGAAADFRAAVVDAPPLVLLGTDGYGKSFVSDADFLQVGGDLLGIVRRDGVGAVRAGLEGWLKEASDGGSGDDVTVGILTR